MQSMIVGFSLIVILDKSQKQTLKLLYRGFQITVPSKGRRFVVWNSILLFILLQFSSLVGIN